MYALCKKMCIFETMIRVIDSLNSIDGNKYRKSKDFAVQNRLFGMNIARGGLPIRAVNASRLIRI